MNKTVKYLTFGVAFSVLCSFSLTAPVLAGPTESPTEFAGVLSMFVQKLEKISEYQNEIQKTLDVKSSFGDLNINSANRLLSLGSGFIGPFQDSLHFGELEGAINSLPDSISDVEAEIIQDQKNNLSEQIENAISSVATETVAGVADVNSSEIANQEQTGSAASRVKTITGAYGEAQSSQEAAQKYVKEAFFYSTYEGDKRSGNPLSDTDLARKKVLANRNAYYREVITSAYAQANEAISTNYEESKKRMEDAMNKAQNAETYDDKKAAEVVIMQNDMRERMTRVSLELAMLEQDTVSMLLGEPADYLVPRSADEIKAETEKQMQKVNFKEEESVK